VAAGHRPERNPEPVPEPEPALGREELTLVADGELVLEPPARPIAGRRVTMRLEGDQPRDRAITVAESIR
jgi:hypothetical protein